MSKINLLPWREEMRKGLNRLFFFVLGVAVFLSLMVVMLVNAYLNYRIEVGNANITYINNEIKNANIEVAEVQKLQEDKRQLLERMQVIRLLQADRISIVTLLDKIPHILPPTVYLTEVSRKEAGEGPIQEPSFIETRKLASNKVSGEKQSDLQDVQKRYLVTIEGISITNVGISDFLKNLEMVKGFSNVKLNEVSINQDGTGLSFKLEFIQNLTGVE